MDTANRIDVGELFGHLFFIIVFPLWGALMIYVGIVNQSHFHLTGLGCFFIGFGLAYGLQIFEFIGDRAFCSVVALSLVPGAAISIVLIYYMGVTLATIFGVVVYFGSTVLFLMLGAFIGTHRYQPLFLSKFLECYSTDRDLS